MNSDGPATGCGLGPPDSNGSAATSGPLDHDYLVQVISAVLYLIGITLCVIGFVGAFLWAPVLWCAATGLIVIAVSFTIGGGRH